MSASWYSICFVFTWVMRNSYWKYFLLANPKMQRKQWHPKVSNPKKHIWWRTKKNLSHETCFSVSGNLDDPFWCARACDLWWHLAMDNWCLGVIFFLRFFLNWLVIWNMFYFSNLGMSFHPNWRTPSFFRGVGGSTTNQLMYLLNIARYLGT